jgi:hypothetical protein
MQAEFGWFLQYFVYTPDSVRLRVPENIHGRMLCAVPQLITFSPVSDGASRAEHGGHAHPRSSSLRLLERPADLIDFGKTVRPPNDDRVGVTRLQS